MGLKVIIPFVNNWNAFGGIDQYVRWRGGQFHDDFYTDATIREWFRSWISHLLNRTNVYTGVKYKDDATIMAWELANEPRDADLSLWHEAVSRVMARYPHPKMLVPGHGAFSFGTPLYQHTLALLVDSDEPEALPTPEELEVSGNEPGN